MTPAVRKRFRMNTRSAGSYTFQPPERLEASSLQEVSDATPACTWAALRTIFAEDEARSQVLRRYILGLAITAFTYAGSGYLRQGCNLVLDADKGREFKAVYSDGRRVDVVLLHSEALAYARQRQPNWAWGDPGKWRSIVIAPKRI